MAGKKHKEPDKIVKTVLDFIQEKKDEELLLSVAKKLRKEAQKKGPQAAKIKITSAVKLNNSVTKKIKTYFKNAVSRDYPLENIIDPDVIGGIKIEWGDWLLDMTLKNRLRKLKTNMKNT